MCKIVHRQWICWYGALWRTSVITDSRLSFYPKIQSNCRLPLGRAQGAHSPGGLGKYCSQGAGALEQREPHIDTRDHGIDSTSSLRIYRSKYGTFRVAP